LENPITNPTSNQYKLAAIVLYISHHRLCKPVICHSVLLLMFRLSSKGLVPLT